MLVKNKKFNIDIDLTAYADYNDRKRFNLSNIHQYKSMCTLLKTKGVYFLENSFISSDEDLIFINDYIDTLNDLKLILKLMHKFDDIRLIQSFILTEGKAPIIKNAYDKMMKEDFKVISADLNSMEDYKKQVGYLYREGHSSQYTESAILLSCIDYGKFIDELLLAYKCKWCEKTGQLLI